MTQPCSERGGPLARPWVLLVCAVALLLAGCANTGPLRAEVSSFGNWPAGRAPGTYVFERLPSQEPNTAIQDRLEAAAQPALAQAGFKPASSPGTADIQVQVASRVRISPRYRYDPVFPVWVPYGYHMHSGVGGWWGPGRGGMAYSVGMDAPYVQMQVDVLMRDRQTSKAIYETHAILDRYGAANPDLFTPLFAAALMDFPQPAISPRVVTMPPLVDPHP